MAVGTGGSRSPSAKGTSKPEAARRAGGKRVSSWPDVREAGEGKRGREKWNKGCKGKKERNRRT